MAYKRRFDDDDTDAMEADAAAAVRQGAAIAAIRDEMNGRNSDERVRDAEYKRGEAAHERAMQMRQRFYESNPSGVASQSERRMLDARMARQDREKQFEHNLMMQIQKDDAAKYIAEHQGQSAAKEAATAQVESAKLQYAAQQELEKTRADAARYAADQQLKGTQATAAASVSAAEAQARGQAALRQFNAEEAAKDRKSREAIAAGKDATSLDRARIFAENKRFMQTQIVDGKLQSEGAKRIKDMIGNISYNDPMAARDPAKMREILVANGIPEDAISAYFGMQKIPMR